ncbi:hypothetical protein [Rhodococcus sp. (in: high G+C Gram-positive bacteria)]|uniref:hypothetical protein n=1 Tax=Rhodococcus sp. TaxID=1831 RepID=UPI003315B663
MRTGRNVEGKIPEWWAELIGMALAELQSANRLIPAGGMALTAEQMEDVRRVMTCGGGLAFEAAHARLRALFPATEPAEEVKPIGWYRAMTRKFATEHFGFPDVTALGRTYTASDGGTWGWCGDDWELLVFPPAPTEPAEEETKAEAEPDLDMHPDAVYGREYVEELKARRIARAEEETKAELCAVRLCVLPARHSGVHADREGLRWNNPTSAPVVPASTETEWPRIEDVPEGMSVKSATLSYPHRWWGGVHREAPADYIEAVNKHYAPFVTAEENS